MDEGFTAQELVVACNKVLVYAGLVARVATVEEVRVVCSGTTLFIAALECFLQRRLEDVIRQPTTPAERAHNSIKVVQILSDVLACDLEHISGKRIVEGNIEDIANLLELLSALAQGKPLLGPPQPEGAAAGAATDRGTTGAEAHADAGPGAGWHEGRAEHQQQQQQQQQEADAQAGWRGYAAGAAVPEQYDGREALDVARGAWLEGGHRHPLGAALSPIYEGASQDRGSLLSRQGATGRAPPRVVRRSSSGGGASSAISIPSGVASARSDRDGAPSRTDSGTASLLEQAMSQAEAELSELGEGYLDFYFEDDRHDDQGRGPRGLRGPPLPPRSQQAQGAGAGRGAGSRQAAQRALRAGPWPDGRGGSVQQHQAFLRRARSALAGDRSSAPAVARAAGLSGADFSGASETSSAAGGRAGGGARRKGGPGPAVAGGPRLRGLPGSSTQPGITRQGHKLLQRTAAAYGAAGVSTAALVAGARAADGDDQGDDASRGSSDGGALGRGLGMAAKPGMHLSADLAAQLRYVHGLTREDPKQQAARAAVERFAVHDEGQRTALRRQLVERLSGARARRDSALRLTADRLREQGQEHSKRVEQLRLQHLAAAWQAKQRGAQMRRSLEAEAALREAFLQVLEGEKEVLLAERRAAKEAAPFPRYKEALRKTERQYLELFSTLETNVASERQQRVRAHREAEQAQRHSRQVAAAVASDRMQELLGRIARDEQVLLQRRSIATQPQSRQELLGQIRRLLGLP